MIRIGVLGSKLFIDAVSIHYALFPEVTFVSYMYESPRKIDHLIEKAGGEVDFLLFSGAIPFYYGQQKRTEYKLKAAFIPFSELMVSLSLFSISYREKLPLAAVSIDLPNHVLLDHVLSEAQINDRPVHVTDYPWIYKMEEDITHLDIARFVRFHTELYREKKTAYALTSIHAVYEELQKLAVPSTYMIQPEQSLKDGLEKAVTLAKLNKAKASQIAVISIKISDYPSSQDSQVFRLQLLQQLHEIGKRLNARVSMDHYQPFLIYTNRGSLESAQKDRNLQLIQELEEKVKFPLQIGIGFGLTMNSAENHATQALYFTEKFSTKKTTIFLLDENKKLIGPLFENEKQYALKNEDQEIQMLAEQLKMNTKKLNRFIDFIGTNQFRSFSAQELADYFEISRRSAERLIKRFLEQDFLNIAGEEQPYDQGRPRALYTATGKLKKYISF
ncbi:hypothetical protein EV207_14522 [Scopulibacillus darangshiensis]|uniref:Transcriptional regulator n=1 Tax=Scopulibacillus darangshiensis TaxID=442528 RepID=A0A4R2NIC8_9BACL|nr:hypothetical protein [Scopulibacillus darangshiensis]TCP21167.1 hypothetical protein EV207_14522 [Scopulibacillus darangshiensis]